jgi:hypothetical protein
MSTDRPRRPTLSLKFPPSLPPPQAKPAAPKPSPFSKPPRARAPAPPPVPVAGWKCKPCGASFDPAPELADEDFVRCPSCNARLGRAGDFRSDPPLIEKLRARSVKR